MNILGLLVCLEIADVEKGEVHMSIKEAKDLLAKIFAVTEAAANLQDVAEELYEDFESWGLTTPGAETPRDRLQEPADRVRDAINEITGRVVR